MNKEEKEIIKHLLKKELEILKKEDVEIEFPSLKFLKSKEMYESEIKKLLKVF